jgi:hypothetical protein
MTEPIQTDPGGESPPAEALVADTATRVAHYAADAPTPESVAPEAAVDEPVAPEWTREQLEQLRDDPAIQELLAEEVEEQVAYLLQLQHEGLLEYEPPAPEPELEPHEIDQWLDEMDRSARVEAFEQGVQTHDAIAEMVRGWAGDLGAQVDPDTVIAQASEVFETAENIGYQLDGDDAIELVRLAAEQFAEFEHAEQRIGDQIAREGQVLGLLGSERAEVRDLAELLLPTVARQRGAADAAAAREAVSQAARMVAGHPDRVVESSRERVFRFGRQAEEARNAGYSSAALRAAHIEQRNEVMRKTSGGRR